ncbi:MAG: MFS transporter [Ghiorsea sp.]
MDNQSEHHQTVPDDVLPLKQKLAYGMGALANNFLGGAIGYMSIVLIVGLGMNPALVGALQAIPRLTDALTDPIMGYISDKTQSRYGRRRPYIFIGAIAVGLIFAMMWQLPEGHGEMWYFWVFLAWSLVFYLAYTMFATPWVALGYEMTPDYHERTRLMGTQNFIGQFAWITLPWFYAIMENDYFFDNAVEGARILAIILGVVVAILGVSSAIICKERFVATGDEVELKLSEIKHHFAEFFKGFLITIKNKDFLKLCVGTFFLFNSLMLVGSFGAFITIYYVAGGDNDMGAKIMGVFGTISTIVTLATIPIVSWVSTKIGKRKTFMLATSFTLFGSLLKWFCYDPSNPWTSFVFGNILQWLGFNPLTPWIILIPAPFIAVGMGSLFTLMSSMMADVCDEDELQTGERREGMFGSIFWWVVKLGMAAAFAGSGFLLNATGFDITLAGNQTVNTFLYMRLCDVFIPVAACTISIAAVAMFTLSETKSYAVRAQLEAKRGNIDGVEQAPAA